MESSTAGPNYDVCRSYEQLPYESGPHYPTHPDCLASVATLMGMAPADVSTARVLELGCGNGGNLIPMASVLPQARFLGFDLSPRQVAQGQELIQAAGLDNVELRAADLLELDEQCGLFDYIVCHGVYSWVPATVRDKILSICHDCLAPHGVAYVSYNTYPGWHFRAVAKEMLRFHTRHLEQPQQRLAESRGLLNFLVQAIPDDETPYARVLRSEAEGFQSEPDYYLVHEFLDEVNQPFYFYQFMEAAAEKGLQFLAEAWHHSRLDDLPPSVQQTLRDISPDLVHLEQYQDFLRKRTFRRTLLCHDTISLSRTPNPPQILGMSVSAMAWPAEGDDPEASSDVLRFRTAANQIITTNHPAVKTLLSRLWELYPRAVEGERLLAEVRGELDSQTDTLHLSAEDFAGLLAQCFLSNALMLHVCPPRFAQELVDTPLAAPLCRAQARLGMAVTNQRHRQFELNDLDRQILSRLDGLRSRQHLVEEIRRDLEDGTLNAELLHAAAPDVPMAEHGGDLGAFVDVSLYRLLANAFLIT